MWSNPAANQPAEEMARSISGVSSKPSPEALTTDGNAQELLQIVRALKAGQIGGRTFEKVVLVGHSYGAFTGMLAANGSGDIDGLIVSGYGHYVDQSFLNIQLNVAAARRSVEIVLQNPGYPDPFVPNPFVPSTSVTPPPSTADTVPNPKTPETRSTSIGIKRELFTGFAVSADYVHARGYNQYAWDDLNYPNPVTGVRPDPTRGRVIIYDNYGNSWNDSLK